MKAAQPTAMRATGSAAESRLASAKSSNVRRQLRRDRGAEIVESLRKCE